MEKVRVRFAPSPTGPLHIGGARSALFNYLFARRFGGQFIVRVEDTDLERSSRESEADILDALEWLGITWDEGVRVGGPHAPYRQTERLAGYRQAAAELVAKGRAYRCYCSEAELEKEREDCLAQGLDPRYGGRCRELTPAAEAAYQAAGRQPVIRFKVPDEGNVVVDDLVRGKVTFDCAGIGDFVIVKSDGIPTYNFAVVMDDVSMGITHVIRGEEHLSNTPRQLLIYEALNLPKPRFAHVSLILGKDRSKMSKRHGATAVGQYRAQGYLPEALVNFLALLGWSPGEEAEVFSLAQLSERFSLDRVAKNPAVFDLEKLNWLNGVYIRQAAPERIAELAAPFLVQAGYLQEPLDAGARAKVALIAAAVQEKIEYVAQVTDYAPLFFGEKVAFASEAEKAVLAGEQVPAVLAAFVRQVARAEELSPAGVKSLLKAVTKETKQKGGRVFMPIRVALTGQQHGPDLQYLIPALGRELVFARVKNTAAQAGIEL